MSSECSPHGLPLLPEDHIVSGGIDVCIAEDADLDAPAIIFAPRARRQRPQGVADYAGAAATHNGLGSNGITAGGSLPSAAQAKPTQHAEEDVQSSAPHHCNGTTAEDNGSAAYSAAGESTLRRRWVMPPSMLPSMEGATPSSASSAPAGSGSLLDAQCQPGERSAADADDLAHCRAGATNGCGGYSNEEAAQLRSLSTFQPVVGLSGNLPGVGGLTSRSSADNLQLQSVSVPAQSAASSGFSSRGALGEEDFDDPSRTPPGSARLFEGRLLTAVARLGALEAENAELRRELHVTREELRLAVKDLRAAHQLLGLGESSGCGDHLLGLGSSRDEVPTPSLTPSLPNMSARTQRLVAEIASGRSVEARRRLQPPSQQEPSYVHSASAASSAISAVAGRGKTFASGQAPVTLRRAAVPTMPLSARTPSGGSMTIPPAAHPVGLGAADSGGVVRSSRRVYASTLGGKQAPSMAYVRESSSSSRPAGRVAEPIAASGDVSVDSVR
eukprot:TRINITY_DN26659_c1_g3_i1.p1 TRINITY_DN26659_c1_g3~~TRINITY_DN26659_c1_g3_i1.p1  ORF type:complete len:501 (+),score=100.53 TRINITY_DN26659_c1_g3_i1:95-1597(+)